MRDDKVERKILADCIWKPIFSAVMTAAYIAMFDSGKWEGVTLALVLGTLCGLSVYKEVKKALSEKGDKSEK